MPAADLLRTLNPDQKRAATAGGHTLVVACPGSGKTRVLMTRAIYLLETNPSAVVCTVTFTRDSATELGERIAKELTPRAAQRIISGTFHSIALRQIRAAGMKPHILGGAEQFTLFTRARDLYNDSLDMESVIQSIEHMKSSIPPQPRKIPAHQEDQDTQLYTNYQRMLKSHNAIDFADIIALAVKGMARGSVRPVTCTHLLVDEFQDADAIQHMWVDAHAAAGSIVTVVGDDDQSVYGWRNARGYSGMSNFRAKHGAETVTLATNYRCTTEILKHAEYVILNNSERMYKQLYAAKGSGGPPEFHLYGELESETQAICDAVESAPQTWAVIARTNAILNSVQLALQAREIPHVRMGGGSIWKIGPISAFISMLNGLVNRKPIFIEHALYWARVPATVLELINEGGLHSPGRHQIPPAVSAGSAVAQQALRFIPTWYESIDAKMELPVILGVASWVRSLMSDKVVKVKSRHRSQFDQAVQTFSRLRGSIKERLRHILSPPEREEDAEGVQLITMHSSKGLEFDNVWVLAANERITPHEDNLDISEERRLFYVAMTRARNKLVMSASTEEGDVSRFVFETGVDLPNISRAA